MATACSLKDLVEAARALEDEGTVVRLVARALSAACPRALGLVYTIRGHPARSVGAVTSGGDAAEPDLERFRRVYGNAQLYYDRACVEPAQRGRWTDVPPVWFERSSFYPIFRPYGRLRRVLVCLGERPLACVGVLLRSAQDGFGRRELRDLDDAIRASTAPLRLAALLAQAEAALHGVEHLLGQRSEPAFLLSQGGQILAASTAGQQALERHAGLHERLTDIVRGARERMLSLRMPGEGLELHLTPCSPRGGSAGYLALLGGATRPARERLTPREAELVAWLEQGLTNARIAARMELASSTVKTMLERLYRKAGVGGRVALLRWARRDPGEASTPRTRAH